MHARRTLHTLRRLTMTRRASIMSGEGTAAHAAEISAESGGWEQLKELAQFGALVAFCNTFVVTNMQCIGPSMLPTLGESGDNVLMIPTASGFKPQRGDVVVCASPTDPTSTVCKRVVGLGVVIRNEVKRPISIIVCCGTVGFVVHQEVHQIDVLQPREGGTAKSPSR